MKTHTKPIDTNQGPLQVRRCVCGGVHICIGGISINLAQESAVYLAERLSLVCDSFKQEAGTCLTAPPVYMEN